MLRILALALAASLTAAVARAQTALEVIVFPSSGGIPLYAAQEKGFFAREGLAVNITSTPSSGYQIQNLVAGKFHLATSALDNLIAYMEGQGTAKLDREPDLVAIMSVGSIELTLMAQPAIKSIAELRGKEFALDSLSTGYAFVLRKMLEKNGLLPADYTFVAVGGTDKRWAALKEGRFAAALMTEPFTALSKAAGFSNLGEGLDAIGPYQATAHITNRAWAKANEQAVVGYLRAVMTGVAWVYDPANRAEAAKILMSRLPDMSEAAAAGAIAGVVEGRGALSRTGEIDLAGVKTVVALREQYGEPKKTLGAAEKYIDTSYFAKARAGR